MPQAHNIGPLFVQVTNFPYEWGNKVVTRGWTQEIEEPFRTSKPIIIRLPKYKAIVFGIWTGAQNEVEALKNALGMREAHENDFKEEAGWKPAPESDREESLNNLYARFNLVDGELDVYDWQTYHLLAEESESSGP